MSEVVIKATPPQLEFHRLKCPFPAFVAGMGTGKSETMCNQAMIDAAIGGDGSLIGLYAPTYDLIRLITAPRMEEKLQQSGIEYSYNKAENIIRTKDRGLGDFILRTMDNPARIVGYETFRSHLDEIDTLKVSKAEEVFERVMQRNRQTPVNAQDGMNRVSSYCTPEGFRFMYKTWDQNPKPGYVQIQASTYSNPFLPESYIENLKNKLTPQLFEAYVQGKYVNLTSGTVYHEFDRKIHVKKLTFDRRKVLHIGMDFNINQMSAIVVQEQDNGDLHAIREHFGLRDTAALAAELLATYGDWGPENIYIYPDATKARSTNSDTTNHAILHAHGFNVLKDESNPGIIDRVNSVNRLFRNYAGYVAIYIDESCEYLADCLITQAYDEKGKPDKDPKDDKSHMPDALGYLVWQMRPIMRKYENFY